MTDRSNEHNSGRRLLVQDAARLEDVEIKHLRVRELLERTGADALLLQEPANIAWFTAGADLTRCAADECATSLFVTADARLFATNSVDSSQIFEREAFGLGFQLKQREWYQPHCELVSDLCRGRKVLSDRGPAGTLHAARKVRRLRLPLTSLEFTRLRQLSAIAVHAVEATGHHLESGVTEAEIAGEVSHRLLKRTVAVARIQVCADGRSERYRHWSFSEQPVQRYAAISCGARRWGLHVGVTRTVCVGDVPTDVAADFQKALLVHATGMFFSRSGQIAGDIWKKVQRIYDKFGIPNEWKRADQGSVVGFTLSEAPIAPGSEYQLPDPVPLFWHPSVGRAMTGDTVLCSETAVRQLTTSPSWPQVTVEVKGCPVTCAGILCVGSGKNAATAAANAESGNPPSAASTPTPRTPSVECPDHPEEDGPDAVESVWELPVPVSHRVWDDEGDNAYSHESVLD
ncbi:MAG: M24 family metallopeptidase [Planctomycetaceae bacterium]|nr:M24 family metallopeptidase [Planctomycetaceae bacterium]